MEFPGDQFFSLTCNAVRDEDCRVFSHPQRTILIIFVSCDLIYKWTKYLTTLCVVYYAHRQLKASATGRAFCQTSPTVTSLENMAGPYPREADEGKVSSYAFCSP